MPQPSTTALTSKVSGVTVHNRTAVATHTTAMAATTVRSTPNLAPMRALNGEANPIITTGAVVRSDP